MPIYPLTYRHWEGERHGWFSRWRAFTSTGVSALWRSRFRKWAVIIAAMPFVGWAFFVYFSTDLLFAEEEGIVNAVLDMIGKDASKLVRENSDARAAYWTYILYGQLTRPSSFFALFIVVVTGSGLIAADRRHNAHEIYFARQVGWWDYVLGKLSVIGFYLAVVLLFPALLLWLEMLMFSPHFSDVFFLLDLAPRLVLCWAAWTILAGLPMLAISSLSSSTGLSAFLWVLIWIGSDLLSGIAHGIRMMVHFGTQGPPRGAFRDGNIPDVMYPNWTEGFSLGDNLISIHHGLLGGDAITRHFGDLPTFGRMVRMSSPGVSPWVSVSILGVLALLSLGILRLRVRPEGAA